MAENDSPGKGQQAGGCSEEFIEPETAVNGIPGLWDVPISNNLAENVIRPFAAGRKNWLFCDSVKGAESSAIVYSLVETAKANDIEPYEYLMLVLSMLPYLGKSSAHEELKKLMPWHPIVRHREHIRK